MSERAVCRRVFLVGAALAVLALSAGSATAIVLPGPGGGGPVYVRKEFHQLTPAEIDAYRKGVELMQSRPMTDPTSWLYQANIHGVPGVNSTCGPPPPEPWPEGWRTCQHSTFFFLPWHRMYLYYFERILRAAVREAIDDPDYPFALPYWNYELHPLLPEPFRQAGPLHAPRSDACNDGLACVPPPFGSSEVALALRHFCNCPGTTSCSGCERYLLSLLTFGSQYTPGSNHSGNIFGHGQLEILPHDLVHVLIDEWMGEVACSARDPIFYLHHANIDRLWQVWLNLGLGRANPLGAENWKNLEFVFFDENRQRVVLTSCQVLDMAGQLGYAYDGVPVQNVKRCEEPILTPANGTPEKETLAASEPAAFDLGAAPASVAVPLSGESDQRILQAALSGSGRVLLLVDGVTLVNSGAAYGVYVNLPPWRLPDPNGPHYAGGLAIFGDPDHSHEQARGFDITEKVRALSRDGLWTNPLTVTFARIDPEEEGDPAVFLRVGGVSIAKQ